jgi:hypothetical protein
MQVDPVNPRTEMDGISSNSNRDSVSEESDEEYETWEGFGLGAYLGPWLTSANFR